MTPLKQINGNGSEVVSANQVGSIVSCSVEKGKNLVSLIRFNSHNDWILDSGATDHICCSLSNLVSFNRISRIHVNLPDGTKVQATHSGSAKIFILEMSSLFPISRIIWCLFLDLFLIPIALLPSPLMMFYPGQEIHQEDWYS